MGMADLPKSFKILVSGGPGTGKSWFGCSFPKVAYIGTEPGGLDSILQNPEPLAMERQKNIVLSETFLPSITEDIKVTFDRMEKAILYAHQQAKEGKVETLFLDNITFLSLNRWLYMDRYERKVSNSGEVDTRGMYGGLALWMYKFILLSIVSFPGHTIISAHEQLESEEDRANSLYANLPITADLLGSMKYRISGLVSASIFLTRKLVAPSKWKFYARCIEGEGKRAKNRYGLGEVLEDISFQRIADSLSNTKVVDK